MFLESNSWNLQLKLHNLHEYHIAFEIVTLTIEKVHAIIFVEIKFSNN
jgi:hypothetical protein